MGLVNATQTEGELISDVISGKGGGIVVCLHGRPGTGKVSSLISIRPARSNYRLLLTMCSDQTLTAQAVAEHLSTLTLSDGLTFLKLICEIPQNVRYIPSGPLSLAWIRLRWKYPSGRRSRSPEFGKISLT
jgi:hypothetical protein